MDINMHMDIYTHCSAAALLAVDRLLPPGGVYAVISFREVRVNPKYLSIYLSTCLHVYLSVYVSMYLAVSIYLSLCI